MTEKGLYCRSGDFYIDPKRSVENAIITHAHSDHARRGSKKYYCTTSGVDLLKARLGDKVSVLSYPYKTQFEINGVGISFHPAGHILGSAQIRVDFKHEVWVVSGDYKRDPDPTCEPFESVSCDVFITEATFGTPAFVWDKNINFSEAIQEWWQINAKQNNNSILIAYSLGKAQRILAMLADSDEPIYCHPAVEEINQCYRNQGIKIANTICLSQLQGETLQNSLIIAPPSFFKSKYAECLGTNYKTAVATGWGLKYSRHKKCFSISDHADWDDLLQTITESQAKIVYVQHRNGALIRKLKSLGIKAFSDTALYPKNPAQLTLF